MDSRADVVEHAGRLLDLGVPVLLTELVPGPETLLEGAVAIRDADGELPAGVRAAQDPPVAARLRRRAA